MHEKFRIPLVIFLSFFLIYWWGSFDKIPFGDCIGFILMAEKGDFVKEATALSHFLYINTVVAVRKIFLLDEILASRLVVITTAALTLLVLFLTVLKLTKNKVVSIAAAVLLGLSFTFWRNAEIVEVYTYNCLLNSLFFYFLADGFLYRRERSIIFATIFLSISLWLHIQNILLIPALMMAFFLGKFSSRTNLISIIVLISSIAGMVLLNNSEGLPLRFIYSSDEGTWVEDTFKKGLSQYFKDIGKAIGYLLYNFHLLVPVGIIGLWQLTKSHRNLGAITVFAAATIFGFATFYAVSDNYAFFIPFNYLFAIFAGYGLHHILVKYKKRSFWAVGVLLGPLLYISASQIILFTDKGREKNRELSFKGGLDYYLIPWLNENTGVVETALKEVPVPENAKWMIWRAELYSQKKKAAGMTEHQLLEL